jgi:hypothetical protein
MHYMVHELLMNGVNYSFMAVHQFGLLAAGATTA